MGKRFGFLLLAFALCICLSGCNALMGGSLLESLGMNFPERAEFFEYVLEIDLPEEKGYTCRELYSDETSEGKTLSLQVVSFEDDEAENAVVDQILANDHWSAQRIPDMLICGQLPGEYREQLEDVRDGYFFAVYEFPEDTWVYEADDASAADRIYIGLFDVEQHRLFYLEYAP